MSRPRVRLLAALLAAALLALGLYRACAAPPVRNLSPRPGPVVILGDSLAAGVGSRSRGHGFVEVLSRRLGVEIVNKGVPGNSTAEGLARLDRDVLALKPSLVILELGGNDFLRRVDTDRVFANLETLIRQCQDSGAAVLLLGVQSGMILDRREKRFRRVARQNGAAYEPNILEGIFGHPALMADSIHPNDAGHQKIAERLEPRLRELLAKLGRLPAGSR